MNIGIDISPLLSPVRTGVGEYTYELLNALFAFDTENHYFLFYNSFQDLSRFVPKWEGKNIHIVSTRWPNKIFHVCVQILKWPKIDRVIQKKTGVTLDYFFSPNIGFQAISKNCKHILTVHDLSFEIFPECFSLKMRLWHAFLNPQRQCLRADEIIVPSENTRQDIMDLYEIAKEKIQVFHFGLSSIFLEKHDNAQASLDLQRKYNLPQKYILFLGTIEPRKNITAVLNAFIESELSKDGYELVIVGAKGWKNKKILKTIEETSSVRYIGYIEPEEKPAFYAGASLFVYPSLYEGFGFPVLEAMACAVPVITSNRSSLPEIAGGSAYYINPYNVSELSAAMKKICTQKDVSQFFVQKGLEHVGQFSWKKTAEQFLSSL